MTCGTSCGSIAPCPGRRRPGSQQRCWPADSPKVPEMPTYLRIVRDVFWPLSLWSSGETAQLRYQRELDRWQFFWADEVRALQLRRLRTLLAHAYEHCPFYRERFDAAGLHPDDVTALEDLRVLPPLEKREIQEQGGR